MAVISMLRVNGPVSRPYCADGNSSCADGKAGVGTLTGSVVFVL
jgi:hypothetical protein